MGCYSKVEIPRSCPIIHPSPEGMTREALQEDKRARRYLNLAMLHNGLGRPQKQQVKKDSATLDQCSNRAKPGQHSVAALRRHKRQKYPRNMHSHVKDVKAYQERDRRYMRPNVVYHRVDCGCGGPFSPACLTGWDGTNLLAHRLHLWSDHSTHPKPCNNLCLQGWSGPHLDAYRQQTWAGHDPMPLFSLDDERWAERYSVHARQHIYSNSEFTRKHQPRLATLDFSNISHRHPDQWTMFENQPHQPLRIWGVVETSARSGRTIQHIKHVHVPDQVRLPLPMRLEQVLEQLPLSLPINNLEEFADPANLHAVNSAAPVKSGSGKKSGSAKRSAPAMISAPVETPEIADARSRKARKVLKQRIAMGLSDGEGPSVVGEGKLPSIFACTYHETD